MAELPSFNFPCPVVFQSWHSEITHLSKLATRPSSSEPLLRLQLLDFSIRFQFSLSQISASLALNLPSVTLKRRFVLGKVCEGPISEETVMFVLPAIVFAFTCWLCFSLLAYG
ncbi:hypothetical protein ACFX1X_011938 [Malus domestica]